MDLYGPNIKRLLSNRFTTVRLSSVERWYAPCAEVAIHLATQLAVVRRCQAGLGGVLLVFQQNTQIERALIKRLN